MPHDATRSGFGSKLRRAGAPIMAAGPWDAAPSASHGWRLWNASDCGPHVVILLLCVLTVSAARALEVGQPGRVGIRGVNISLPQVCAYQRITGHDCPGCGLTRCFVSLANGRIASAWSYNPVGCVFFVVVVLQIPYRTLQIWRLVHGRSAIRLCSELLVIWPLLIALLTQWLWRSLGWLVA